MSIRIMTAVWEVELPDSEKIVLLALADSANDEGGCWPSMASLARKCSKSDRTVQAAVKALEDKGHITRDVRPGRGVFYHVHPRSGCTPEEIAPPKPLPVTPEAASDKPSRTNIPPNPLATGQRPVRPDAGGRRRRERASIEDGAADTPDCSAGGAMPTDFAKTGEPAICAEIREWVCRSVGARTYQSWFDPPDFAVAGDWLRVTARTQFAADWIRNNMLGALQSAAARAIGKTAKVEVKAHA